MSRAMLYAGRWAEAKRAAEEVEKLGYTLEENYADSYMKSVAEGIRKQSCNTASTVNWT